jgi:hypothetical protein
METVIKLSPSELNETLLNKIRSLIGNKKNVNVTISLEEFDLDYAEALDRSITEAESGDVISMTMKEFAAYTPVKK